MFDEVYCDAPLPDEYCAADPCMVRYRITASGRFVDWDGNDMEPDGYVMFYAFPKNRSSSEVTAELVEYRAKFVAGSLDGIVRVRSTERCEFRFGLASFRWFQSRSFLSRSARTCGAVSVPHG